jgi:hypothetical protein
MDFEEVQPEWNPARFADERRAWNGHYPGQPDLEVRVEAAGYRGRATYFDVLLPFSTAWLEPADEVQPPLDRAIEGMVAVMTVLAIVGAAWFARRNLRQGSGDRRGAVRLGVVVFVSSMLAGLLTWRPATLVAGGIGPPLLALAVAILIALWTACAYLALEPYARRLWPQTLITWTRVLMGRFNDPRVGRDMLIGGVAGTAIIVMQRLDGILPALFGGLTRQPFGNSLDQGLHAFGAIIRPDVLAYPMFVLLLLTAMLYLVRKRWLAIGVTVFLLILLDGYWKGAEAIGEIALLTAVGETVIVWSVMTALLIRFGLFAQVVAFFFAFRLQHWTVTFDTSAWYAGSSFIVVGLLDVLSLFALRTAVRGAGLRDDREAAFVEST